MGDAAGGRRRRRRPEALLDEAPTAVGMFSVALSAGGSFDSAVRDIAANGPENFREMFGRIVMDADCRASPDIGDGVDRLLASLPKELSPFRRAMHMVVTAFEEPDRAEAMSMMKDAEALTLEGLRQMGEAYSSGLSTPCMLIFGLGVMVPMILVSILPMLSIGGQFGVSIDAGLIPVLTLVAIPAAVAAVVASMKGRNPFFRMAGSRGDLAALAPLLSFLPALGVCAALGLGPEASVMASAAAAGLLTLAVLAPRIAAEEGRRRTEEVLKDVMFELGNRLLMGENYEVALSRSMESRRDCGHLHASVSREIAICRGDVEGAVHRSLDRYSTRMADLYCDVYRASVRDIRDSGRLAGSIAHQLHDQNGVRKGIENKMKSMLDMMTGTAAVFAPLILGMSVVMMKPLSELTEAGGMEAVPMVLVVYLIELAALISALSSSLMCRGGAVNVVARFSAMTAAAMAVFAVCSSMTL